MHTNIYIYTNEYQYTIHQRTKKQYLGLGGLVLAADGAGFGLGVDGDGGGDKR